MPTNVYELYRPQDLNFSGTFSGTIALDASYNPADDTILTVEDDDDFFNGDFAADEVGRDTNQFGTANFADGSTLGSPTTQVYSEWQHTLTAPGEPDITMLLVEIGGQVVGYLPTSPLTPGVTYSFTTANTVPQFGGTPSNAVDFDDIEGAICFTADCMIETDTGLMSAADLSIGTLIKTRDNSYQPLRWIFRRRIYHKELQAHTSLRPILFEPEVLGPDMPNKPMHLSPQHRVVRMSALNELHFGESTLLVPAKALVNGDGIRVDETIKEIEYIHLLMDRHEVIYCDGIEAETFDPGRWAMQLMSPDARAELETLFPELAHGQLPADFYQYRSISVREAALLTNN